MIFLDVSFSVSMYGLKISNNLQFFQNFNPFSSLSSVAVSKSL